MRERADPDLLALDTDTVLFEDPGFKCVDPTTLQWGGVQPCGAKPVRAYFAWAVMSARRPALAEWQSLKHTSCVSEACVAPL